MSLFADHPTEIAYIDRHRWLPHYRKFGRDVLRLALDHTNVRFERDGVNEDANVSSFGYKIVIPESMGDISWSYDRLVIADCEGNELICLHGDDERTVGEAMLSLTNPALVYYVFLYTCSNRIDAYDFENMDVIEVDCSGYNPDRPAFDDHVTIFESHNCKGDSLNKTPWALLQDEVQYCKKIVHLS